MIDQGCPHQNRRAFTFLELVAVILIISILGAMVLAAAGRLRLNALRSKASTEASCIAQALSAYRLASGSWPCQTQNNIDITWTANANIMRALRDNPRRQVFIELPFSSGIGEQSTECLDPWGRSYLVAMDENADGSVFMSATLDGITFSTNAKASAAVASWGPDPSKPHLRIFQCAP